MPVLQLGVSAIALLSLFLLWWQLRQTTKWNRLQSQQTFLSRSSKEIERENITAAREAGVELQARIEPLTHEEVEKIWGHPRAYHALMALINDFEMTCMAIQAGVADEEVAYNAHQSRVTRGYYVYEPFVSRIRVHHENNDAFCEWEKVAERWKMRKTKDLEQKKIDREKQDRKLKEKSGVIRRV